MRLKVIVIVLLTKLIAQAEGYRPGYTGLAEWNSIVKDSRFSRDPNQPDPFEKLFPNPLRSNKKPQKSQVAKLLQKVLGKDDVNIVEPEECCEDLPPYCTTPLETEVCKFYPDQHRPNQCRCAVRSFTDILAKSVVTFLDASSSAVSRKNFCSLVRNLAHGSKKVFDVIKKGVQEKKPLKVPIKPCVPRVPCTEKPPCCTTTPPCQPTCRPTPETKIIEAVQICGGSDDPPKLIKRNTFSHKFRKPCPRKRPAVSAVLIHPQDKNRLVLNVGSNITQALFPFVGKWKTGNSIKDKCENYVKSKINHMNSVKFKGCLPTITKASVSTSDGRIMPTTSIRNPPPPPRILPNRASNLTYQTPSNKSEAKSCLLKNFFRRRHSKGLLREKEAIDPLWYQESHLLDRSGRLRVNGERRGRFKF